MSTVLLWLVVVLPLFVLLPAVIGVYVFRDARRRDMPAALWALLAVLVPGLIGLAVYLLARNGHSDRKCAVCGKTVEETHVICPHCGCRLKECCTVCGTPLDADWCRCPMCSAAVPRQGTAKPPVRKTDPWLKRILSAVLVVPVVILCMTVFVLQMMNRSAGVNLTRLTPEDYLAEKDNAVLETWMENCEANPGRAYVLRHKTVVHEQPVVQYLIYYPAAGAGFTVDADHEEALLDTTLQVDFHRSEDSASEGICLCTVSIYSAAAPRLKIFSEGRSLEYELEDVDFDLTLFELMAS